MTLYDEIAEAALPMRSDRDVLKARSYANHLTAPLRFSNSERAMITIVISEIARNTVLYATHGTMLLKLVSQEDRRGLLIVVQDQGPGIADLKLAMQDGYTTSKGLGIGLPGARRLMDEFEIISEFGKGTTITMTKWEKIAG